MQDSATAIETVFSYPKLNQWLLSHPQDKKRAQAIFKEVHGDFSPSLVKTIMKVIDATFLKLYDGINLKIPEKMDFHSLHEKYHLILVPNHQSHADYIALTYTIFKNFEIPIYVAGGINLNIFPIGNLFRKGGAFFIRRSFHSDQLYKLTFEAYIFYLLKNNLMVEFFFEGGRTRTGKLLKPRFGLFQMLLEAHQSVPDKKQLMFIPVSLAHEQIPEERAHAKELAGAQKSPESPLQLLKLYKLFTKKLGTIHIHFGDPIKMQEGWTDLKLATQDLAFDCFKAVGKGMPITPSSLLSLIMLDEPSGALTWKQIEQRAQDVIDYCQHLAIPLTPSLISPQRMEALRTSLDMLINNKKVEVIQREKLNQIFYVIKTQRRVEVLYQKNMILHHFIVPGIINATWFNIFKGEIKDGLGLTKFLMNKRKELKYEFYLPSVKEMIYHALDIISYALDRRVVSLEECMNLSSQDLFLIATKVRRFSTAFSYLYEAYYLSAITLKYLANQSFNMDKFLQVSYELFTLEIEHGRVIKYPESYIVPILKETIPYYVNQKIIEPVSENNKLFRVASLEKLDLAVEKFLTDLNDQVAINLKFNRQ